MPEDSLMKICKMWLKKSEEDSLEDKNTKITKL